MSDFVKFLGKYADEILSVSDALTTVISGVALNPNDAARVHSVIDNLRNASEAIMGGLGDIKEAKIVIQKKDIEAAVNAKLPSLLPSNDEIKTMLSVLVAEAVRAEMEKVTKPDA